MHKFVAEFICTSAERLDVSSATWAYRKSRRHVSTVAVRT